MMLRSVLLWAVLPLAAFGQPFQLPTANHALYEPGGEERFFVGTVGKSWTSGTFGCVRSEGNQLHEGLDICCLQRDRRGEPTDPVVATADGVVAYCNHKQGLSNFGKYLILRHQIEGLEVYSLYAHLQEIRSGLAPGQPVRAGEPVGVMGRTANTHEGISKDRAHVHFELNLLVNERFSTWFKKACPGERNDHGGWNGQNLLGFDPRLVLLAEKEQGAKFSLLSFLRNQTELCRVAVRQPSFSWVRRYAPLVQPNPVAQREGVAGYELALDYNGIPFRVIPRAASELKGKAKYQLLSVNEAEFQKNHARHLVVRRGGGWTLTPHGTRLLDLLTF
jgi:murein DD-endopeptidase MepM/ murein hydrolase activator NlpD